MNKILLFAGTSEGHQLCEEFRGLPIEIFVSVATEYGGTLIENSDNIHVLPGIKRAADIRKLLADTGAELLIDATHPYAASVTGTLRTVCSDADIEYIRLLRSGFEESADCLYADSDEDAVKFLGQTDGPILLTVGSKELPTYTKLPQWQERITARVLSVPASVESAAALGFQGKNLICMQGPFSVEMNMAMLRMTGARYLVTKDSGDAGGFAEKLEAARQCQAKLLIIRRPVCESGLSYAECVRELERRFHFSVPKSVKIVGLGMGDWGSMTLEAQRACREAELIIGAKTLQEKFSHLGKLTTAAVTSEEIAATIHAHKARKIAAVMSGDSGFYSGSKKLLPLLHHCRCQVIPGISSFSYLCARLGESWDDAALLSAHGRDCNLPYHVRKNRKTLVLTGGEGSGISALIGQLCEYGLGDSEIAVGENLSYPDERITSGIATDLKEKTFAPLSVMLIKNENAAAFLTAPGRPDDNFLRTQVPMTKQEVRAVTLAKLAPTENSICWDVGAGTGSVSLELADCCSRGVVYAIEQKEDASDLVERNKRHLGVFNLQVIRGTAPAALSDLPAPTHVFIGGSNGNMRDILSAALEKNPAVRIVLNVITAENFAEAVNCLKKLPVSDMDITQISAARGKKSGDYHLMNAINPVYIIACTGESHA